MKAVTLMRASLAVVPTIILSGCVTFQRPQYQAVSAEVIPVSGFDIHDPAAIVDPGGLRFHGWVCRQLPGGFAPRKIRVEQLDEKGLAVANAAAPVNVPSRIGCSLYDIRTNWHLPVGARVRLCKNDGPCTAKSATDQTTQKKL